MSNADYDEILSQTERAIAAAPERIRVSADTTLQALRLLREHLPAVGPVRGALLAIEETLAESLQLNVWLMHARREHDRAAELVDVSRRVQRALTDMLEETR